MWREIMPKKQRLVVEVLIAMVIVLGSVGSVFGLNQPLNQIENGEIMPFDTGSCTISVSRESATKGGSAVSATFTDIVDYGSLTITLRERSGNQWVTATGVSPVTQSTSVTNRASIFLPCEWNLVSGKVYSVSVKVVDKYDGVTSTSTYTSSQF